MPGRKPDHHLNVSGLAATADDTAAVLAICNEIGVDDVEIVSAEREPVMVHNDAAAAGQQQRHQHLIVKLRDAVARRKLLSASWKLNGIAARENVYIGPDWSPLQARQLHSLRLRRKELNDKEADVGQKWMISGFELKRRCDMPQRRMGTD
jgi:hypothetical protein